MCWKRPFTSAWSVWELGKNIRTWVQLAYAAATNGYLAGFARGKIYQGKLKAVCVPGLNCYSCPGALGSCPIGALQAVLGSYDYKFSFYLFGFFMAVGAILGRFVCGWLCPFGLVQDLLYKIPFFKKRKNIPGHKYLKLLKYFILIGFVIIIPLFVVDIIGQGEPGFCKYICPSGTLFGGWTLYALDDGVRQAAGWLFAWKSAVLLCLIVLSLWVYRPFCKYLCPLGAVYGCFNPIAFYKIQIDETKCTQCGKCRSACPMDIPVHITPNNPECIRCGECKKNCPHSAIAVGFQLKKECMNKSFSNRT